MSQYTIIITDDIKNTNISIKKGRGKELKKQSKTYIVTEDNHHILLAKPRTSVLRGRNADVVINETEKTRFTELAAAPEAVTINLHEDQPVEIEQKAREKAKQEHKHSNPDVKTAKSGNQMIYRCKECDRSLGTEKEINKWFEEEIL